MTRSTLGSLPGLVALLAGSSAGPVAASESIASRLPDALVRLHGLAPLAYRAGVARFRPDFAANAVLATLRARLVDEAVGALSARSIPVILLKGISYVGYIYDDPAERPMADIDLLVRPGDHGRAVRALVGRGFRESGRRHEGSAIHHVKTLLRGEDNIDLHRSLTQPLRSRIDVAGVFDRARPAVERGDGALRMDPVDEATLHLVHIARHELIVPAISYVEAGRVLDVGPGRHAVLQRAREFRMRRGVAAALAMWDALAGGDRTVTGPAWVAMPAPAEILAAKPCRRATQVIRKLSLLEGPRELVGLAAVVSVEAVFELVASYRRS